MELSDYLRILRKRWIVIVALTLLGVAAASTLTILATPKYQASTLVYVQVSASTVGDLAQGGAFAQNQAKSYAEVVSTPRVLDSVVKDLNLNTTAAALAASVTADAPTLTVNIRITVTRDSPTQAAQIANAVTASFKQVISEITKPAAGGPQVSISVLQNATVPSGPSSPNAGFNLALGLLVGLALGVGIAVLWQVLDTRIRGERDVDAITKAPVIGGITFDPNAIKRPLIVQDDPHSVRAEAFRTLRTNLQFLDIESGARSFAITSSIPSEGKSTTAANLAIALADAGAHVAIIDADLRRPKLAEYFGIEGAVGLTDVLISRATLADVLQPWGRGNLLVLPAGTVPPNPSELLGSRAMASVLHTLEEEFDVVLIDLPPLLPFTDGALVSKLTRGAIVVVAAGRTHKGEFGGAIAALENVGAHVAGIIMTMLPSKGPDAYGYGGYGGYGYGGSAPATHTYDAELQPAVSGTTRLSPDWGRDGQEPTS